MLERQRLGWIIRPEPAIARRTIIGVGGGPAQPAALVAIDAASGRHQELREAADLPGGTDASDARSERWVVHQPRTRRRHGRLPRITRYGRGYREQIYGQWGVADVEDRATVAHGLVERWSADPARMATRGTGAGGTLALEALATPTCSPPPRSAPRSPI